MTVNPEGIIPLAGGIMAYLAASGRLNISGDPDRWEEWRQKWGSKVRPLAVVVTLFGAAQFLGLLGR